MVALQPSERAPRLPVLPTFAKELGMPYPTRSNEGMSIDFPRVFARFASIALQSLVPFSCPCGESGLHLCDECAGEFSRGTVWVEGVCEGVCEARPSADGRELEIAPAFRVATLAEYEGRVKSAILDYKNGGHFALANYLGPLLADALTELSEGCMHRHVIVPVPSRAEAVRRRGEDHMRLLAESVGAHARVGVAPALVLSGMSQHSRTKRERARGTERVIGPKRVAEWEGMRGAQAVILDDVVTTGSTLKKTSDALEALGVRTCAALTIASARLPRANTPILPV